MPDREEVKMAAMGSIFYQFESEVNVVDDCTMLELLLIAIRAWNTALFMRAVRGEYSEYNKTDEEIRETVKRLYHSRYCLTIRDGVKDLGLSIGAEKYRVYLICNIDELVNEQLLDATEVDQDWNSLRDMLADDFIDRQQAKEEFEKKWKEKERPVSVALLRALGTVKINDEITIFIRDVWHNRYEPEQEECYRFKDGSEFPDSDGTGFLWKYKQLGYEVLSS